MKAVPCCSKAKNKAGRHGFWGGESAQTIALSCKPAFNTELEERYHLLLTEDGSTTLMRDGMAIARMSRQARQPQTSLSAGARCVSQGCCYRPARVTVGADRLARTGNGPGNSRARRRNDMRMRGVATGGGAMVVPAGTWRVRQLPGIHSPSAADRNTGRAAARIGVHPEPGVGSISIIQK